MLSTSRISLPSRYRPATRDREGKRCLPIPHNWLINAPLVGHAKGVTAPGVSIAPEVVLFQVEAAVAQRLAVVDAVARCTSVEADAWATVAQGLVDPQQVTAGAIEQIK